MNLESQKKILFLNGDTDFAVPNAKSGKTKYGAQKLLNPRTHIVLIYYLYTLLRIKRGMSFSLKIRQLCKPIKEKGKIEALREFPNSNSAISTPVLNLISEYVV